MFFRRKKKSNNDSSSLEVHQPILDKDGLLYVEEGQEYDQNLYETDSDYDDEDSSAESVDGSDDGDNGDDGDDTSDIGSEGESRNDNDYACVEGKGEEMIHDNDEERKEEALSYWQGGNSGHDDEEQQGEEDVKEEEEEEELIPWDDSVESNEAIDEMETEEKEEVEMQVGQPKGKEEELPPSDRETMLTNGINNENDSGDEEEQEEQKESKTNFTTTNGNTKMDHDEKEALVPSENGHGTPHPTTTDATKNDSEDVMKEATEVEKEEQTPITSLHEKKSLLALAAQHDRVDIIKTILQSTSTTQQHQTSTTTQHDLIQLLLNNKLIARNGCNTNSTTNDSSSTTTPSSKFTQNDLEKVFLSPLHIAIASASTNAASCLLRMGSDPSIRTAIPNEWDGPTWLEDSNNNNDPKKKDERIRYWKKLNGLSAWEVAFTKKNGKNDDITSSSRGGNGDNSPSKPSWFGSWSSSSTTNGHQSSSSSSLFDISPSKLEGIKHAFTAEALRAIGSDEVHRLRELINSGLLDTPSSSSSPSTAVGVDEGQDGSRGVEIGGKDLLSWCVEMNAERCSVMLKEVYNKDSKTTSSNEKNDVVNVSKKNEMEKVKQSNEKASSVEEEISTTAVTMATSTSSVGVIDDTEITPEHLLTLKIKLEENKVLAGSLSLVLDNLAEEVSLTQGLLYQQVGGGDDNSNTALISQVRRLKESRSDIEMEISDWEGRLADRIVELRLVLTWWKKKGGSENDFMEIFDNGGDVAALNDHSTFVPVVNAQQDEVKEGSATDTNNHPSLRSKIMEMKAQVSLIQNKVTKLRSSIADLAEENSQNLLEVTKMGLGGAVNLARTLKEEVKEREHILQNLQQREAACRTRICMIRSQLEKASSPSMEATTVHSNNEDGVGEETNGTVVVNDDTVENISSNQQERCESAPLSFTHVSRPNNNSVHQEEVNTNTNNTNNTEEVEDEDVIYYDEEEDCIIEYVDDSDGSDVEYEYYTDDEEDDDDIPLSEAVRTGKSNVLTIHEEPHVFLSFKLWELFLRIVGLSKKAIQETVKSNGFDNLGNLPRAMIV